jgi:hypothetical protein
MPQQRISRRAMGAAAVGSAVGGIVFALPQPTVFGEVSAGALAQATAVSPQGASPQPTPAGGARRDVRFYPIDSQFQAYYNQIEGPRTLGGAISPVTTTVDGFPAQYFEKARLENRTAANRTGNAAYNFEFGLLVDEIKAVRSLQAVGGDASNVTYATLQDQSDAARRVAPPANANGPQSRPDGSVFVPFTADLSAAPGHVVPGFFWEFMQRADLFPAGWLHDIGLPITPALQAVVDKGRILGTTVTRFTAVPITVQAFQRTILTYDPANPAGFLTERANTGTDYMAVFPERVPT